MSTNITKSPNPIDLKIQVARIQELIFTSTRDILQTRKNLETFQSKLDFQSAEPLPPGYVS